MRQAGALAAAGLVALEHELPRLAEDHEKDRRLAEALLELPGVSLDLATVQTNMVRFNVVREDLSAPELCSRLAEYGVLAVPADATAVRLVTHRDVALADTDQVCRALREILA